MPRKNTRIPFLEAVLQSDIDACIVWPFAKRKGTKYGHFSIWQNNKQHNYYVHNYVCLLIYGKRPEGMETAHNCGNPLCVNPKHLRWATHSDNMQDAKNHGTLCGGGRGRQKIFAYDRAVIAASKDSLVTIAARYGMEPAYIGRVRRMPLQYDL